MRAITQCQITCMLIGPLCVSYYVTIKLNKGNTTKQI